MAQQFFGGTIQTLSNLIQQEKRERFLKQTPEYQQGLFNLMRAKEQALFQDTLRQQIMNGTISPVDAAVLMGEFAPFTQQLRGQQYQTRAKIEGLEAEKERGFEEQQALREHGYKIAEIEAANKGRLQIKQTPARSAKILSAREEVAKTILTKWNKETQSYGEFYNTLGQKEQEVLDKVQRSMSLFDFVNLANDISAGQTTEENELPEL